MWEPREDPGQSPQGHLGIVCPAAWQSSRQSPVFLLEVVGRVRHLQLSFQAVRADAEYAVDKMTSSK